MQQNYPYLLVIIFTIISCNILDPDREPDVIVTNKNIYKVQTDRYEEVTSDTLRDDAISARRYDGKWYCEVPIYKYQFYSSVKNKGSDVAGNVKGEVYIYLKDELICNFTIYYADFLYPDQTEDVSQDIDITGYDYFDLELSYYDTDMYDKNDDDDDCDCY